MDSIGAAGIHHARRGVNDCALMRAALRDKRLHRAYSGRRGLRRASGVPVVAVELGGRARSGPQECCNDVRVTP